MRRGLNFKSRAILRDEVEWSVYLTRGRQTTEDIADEVFSKHANVGVLLGQIPKRPAIEAEHIQSFAKCSDPGHFVFYCAFGATT